MEGGRRGEGREKGSKGGKGVWWCNWDVIEQVCVQSLVKMEVTNEGHRASVAQVAQKFEVQTWLATSLGPGPGHQLAMDNEKA